MPHAAVLSRAPKICVIAAPGSGKSTAIIIPKTVALIEDDGIPAHEILLLSFSRLSALDLRQKVGAAVANPPRASTVHSIALSFLLSEDNHDIRNRIESVLLDFQKAVLVSDLKTVFPQINRTDLKQTLREFAAGWATRPNADVFEADDDQRRFKAAVILWLTEHEAAMMEEIIHHAADLARQLPDAEFLTTPKHVLVDEYQDLNRVEQAFVSLLTREAESVLIVGDPDQSIYGFKFAYPHGIRDFHGQADVEPYQSLTTYRCPRAVVRVANDLLVQADPARRDLLEAFPEAIEGETHFVRRETQDEEFGHALHSIADRISAGTAANQIIVLAPRRELASMFAEYAEEHRADIGIPANVSFVAVQKADLSVVEQERLSMLAILARPNSLLQIRSYLGLTDDYYYAAELADLKRRYGGLRQVIENADPAHFPRSVRRRRLCDRAIALRQFLRAHDGQQDVQAALDELLPMADEETADLRFVFDGLREADDTLQDLFRKYIDHSREVPEDANVVRSMTLMASKGLGAEHIYIIGCNAGNIPGENRSVHMSNAEHRLEQLRLLYVGFTRATRSLSVSWSRRIPFQQARRQHNPPLRIRRQGGQAVGELGLSDFLQNLPNIRWE